MSEIKAIIFDLGGVITDLSEVKTNYQELLIKHNKIGNAAWKDFRIEWNKAKVGEINSDEFYEIVSKSLDIPFNEIKETFSYLKIDEEMKNLVLELEKNYKIGILTNIIDHTLEIVLEKWDFRKIAVLSASCEDNVAKPELEAIDKVLSKMKLNKGDIIFVDDTQDTIEKYNNYGVKSILFENKDKLIEDLRKLGVRI